MHWPKSGRYTWPLSPQTPQGKVEAYRSPLGQHASPCRQSTGAYCDGLDGRQETALARGHDLELHIQQLLAAFQT